METREGLGLCVDQPWRCTVEREFRARRAIGRRGGRDGMGRCGHCLAERVKEAVGFVRSLLWDLPTARFDAAFAKNQE